MMSDGFTGGVDDLGVSFTGKKGDEDGGFFSMVT